ncbi:acyl-CoA dehydrogenase family protein [Candidatus Omnitrophota bacterium]
MLNFYQDNPDILFNLKNMDLKEIIELKEDGFSDKNEYLDAPSGVKETLDNYALVLDLVGEIAGEYLSPDAAEVDKIGATFKDGEVKYPDSINAIIKRLSDANLMGFTFSRKYGGLNLPKTIYSMAIELVSRADASFMTIFGLQEIADTISHFGNDDQRSRYLPRFSSGEVLGAMALTEPDAGSDLQAVQLKAFQDEKGTWRLNGVKRFITNGCAKIILVLARSEEDIADGRGLSLFIYERDKDMTIRRIEDKLGIHGSPTCELQFNDAKTELLGQRKRGLIKYTWSLMSGARLGVSAQAVGIAEAAYREAVLYASKRIQFKKTIDNFPPVYEMLTDMKISIEAGRALLYEAAQMVDMKEGLERRIEIHPETKADLKIRLRRYTDFEQLFTSLLKSYTTEMANRVCYDALQIHGGVGYTRSFAVERLSRDARITSIYEGTTQLQVVAATGALLKGTVSKRLTDYESDYGLQQVPKLFEGAKKLREMLESAIVHVQEKADTTYTEYHARRLVEMAADTIMSYLLCISALASDKKKKTATIFISKATHKIRSALDYILSDDKSLIDFHQDITSPD